MIPIRDTDRLERLEHALLAIEGLTYLHPDPEDKLNGQIYTIAHVTKNGNQHATRKVRFIF